MEAFLSKISEYNLFNYLLPGAVFVYLMDMFGDAHLLHENILINFFMLYFVGMVMSRVGSLVIEPVLIKVKFIRYAPYEDYLKAIKVDEKIPTLLLENNTYRTFITVFTIAPIILIHTLLCESMWAESAGVWICIAILVLFLSAFRKQTNFIRRRVEVAIR